MSYNVKSRHTYKPQRAKMRQMVSATPTHHESFRREWDSNFDSAIRQALALKDKGFLVEEGIGRGALMESQAKRIAKNLQQAGWEVELIPVAQWAGENVVFLVYKPPKEGEAIPPKPTAPQPKPRKSKQPSPEQLVFNFVKNFTYKTKYSQSVPDPAQMQTKGYMVDPKNVAALINPNAPTTDPLVEMYRDARQKPTPNPITFTNTSKFRATVSTFKNTLRKANVAFTPNNAVAIDNFLKALRVLGDGPIQVYFGGNERPVYLAREDGWAVAIAPVIDPYAPVSIDDIIREATATFGTS